ncbi:MAG: translation initiation factor IF-2 [Bacilli bacterium]|mgnify:FL=1|nr:translation initiation factor IF-2 [Bacilli bacterium]MDD7314887.1 translation initiation factor IF-2 [Bacilli bacterium]
MKVKELAEIFKVSPAELLKILPNVGVDVSLKEETMIDKDVEKKLAKRYNVPYPFKKAAPKPKPVEAPHVAQKPTVEEKPKPRVTPKPATEIPKKPVETPHVVKKPIVEEIIQPRVDEETLEKYQEFLEDDEYNITRENKGRGRRQTQGEENQTPHSKKKNNNKNKQSKNKERRTSNIPTKEDKEDNVLYYENGMTVMEIAEAMHLSVTELVKKLFVSMGILANATQSLDRDTAELVAMEYNYELKDKQITDLTRFDEMTFDDDDEKDLVSRPAIVTIMGHVDHGKTTLLDTIRSSHVVSGEAGGITQHIGAYQVEKNGKLITFIDTPGHAAFTEMRARGAQITDIVVLVVAADDGVMPQTKEAIEHAQAANVPIIVAINKMDKPGVNPDRIKQELTEYGLLAEEWGGDTIFVPISALTGKGVDELLEMIILVSEMKDYKANPNRLGTGTVIEAKLDKGKGPVATLLVQNGTIKIGDIVVVGNTYGKIRAMQNELGQPIKSAGPSKPVEITGIMEVPFAGEKFVVINDERKAKTIAETRAFNKFSQEKNGAKAASLTDIFKGEDDGSIKTLNLIIKCDVQGSIEAIKGLLDKIKIEGTRINIVGARVGGITDNDISLAIASNAIIIGFNIRPLAQITDLAKEKGVEIRLYNIIYKLQEDIENAVKGMLDPVYEEKESGQAEVRETFKVSKVGTIAGCYVLSGSFVRNGGVRVVRDSIVVYTGKIGSLKRFKDDVKEVKAGYECGITIENFNDIKVGDILECFVMEEKERE